MVLKIDFENTLKSGIAPIELLMALIDDLVAVTPADINIRPPGHGVGVGVYK